MISDMDISEYLILKPSGSLTVMTNQVQMKSPSHHLKSFGLSFLCVVFMVREELQDDEQSPSSHRSY